MTTQKRGRGRPKGAANKPKANGSALKGTGRPTKEAGKGHNGGPPNLTDDELKALMLDHARNVRNIEAEQAALKEKRKKAIGLAKADGIPAKDITAFNKLLDTDDDDILEENRKRRRHLSWQGRGIQDDLFDGSGPPKEELDAIRAEGFRAGAEGKKCECDYTAPEMIAAWTESWHRGEKALKSAVAKKTAEEQGEDGGFVDKTHAERMAQADEDTNVVPIKGNGADNGEGAPA